MPWDGSAALDWHVAADDRWHTPATEVAVRQRHLHGAPVAETRLRIPGGDAIHRVWTVADGGGCTLVEVANDSPLPIACAFTRRDVLTNRPPADVPIQGIDLPAATTVVVPIAHRTSVTVGLAHDGRGAGALPPRLPSAEATARGWVALAERASRLVLPDEGDVERVVAARCELLLAGPPDAAVDPAGYLLGVGELVRMGEVDDPTALVPDVAAAVEAIARSDGRDVAAALDAAAMILHRAGEHRALLDLGAIRLGIRDDPRPETDRAQIGGGRWPRSSDGWRGVPSCCRRGSRRRGWVPTSRPTARCRAVVDAVVRRALARRAPGRAVAGRRRSRRAHRARPSTRRGGPRDPSGEALWRRVSRPAGG